MIKISGLWIKVIAGKPAMMVGSLGGVRLLVFKNQFKTDDRHPDYILYLEEARPKTDADSKEGEDVIPF